MSSKIRRKKPRHRITNPYRQRSVVHVFEKDFSGLVEALYYMSREIIYESFVVDFDDQFKVEAQASRIDIGGTDMGIVIVNDKKLGVDKGRWLVKNPDPPLQELPEHVGCCPVDERKIALGG